MKILTVILFLFLTSSAFTQGLGTGGGKGPNQDSTNEHCVELEGKISYLEERFVEMYDRKYRDEKDFTLLLEQIIVDSTSDVLDKLHKHNNAKEGDTCTETESANRIIIKIRPNKKAEVAVLKEIQSVYAREVKTNIRCPQFKLRLQSLETLEHVIKFYE